HRPRRPRTADLHLFAVSSPPCLSCFFFFNDTATTEIYTLSLHDALPIFWLHVQLPFGLFAFLSPSLSKPIFFFISRSEEHTSELQSQFHLVCRLLLE